MSQINYLNYSFLLLKHLHANMTYAIIEIGGHQLLVKPGYFYDLHKIPLDVGKTILFKKVLLLNNQGFIKIGRPCLFNVKILATVEQHLRSKKLTVFKMKSKKKTRCRQGHRQDLTRLKIHSIYIDNVKIE